MGDEINANDNGSMSSRSLGKGGGKGKRNIGPMRDGGLDARACVVGVDKRHVEDCVRDSTRKSMGSSSEINTATELAKSWFMTGTA